MQHHQQPFAVARTGALPPAPALYGCAAAALLEQALMQDLTLDQRYASTAPEFRSEIERLAAQAGKTPLAVYAFWREYSKECDRRDQSAVMGEFQEWYKTELMPAQVAKAEEYAAKKEARIERLEDMASKTKHRANALHEQAHKMASVIPFGQPILVGHHNERRDRNYRGKIESKFRKSFEEQEKSAYYARRAENAASNDAIASDDPTADTKLAAKIADAERLQEAMRACNAAIRKHAKAGPAAQVAALVALGRTEAQAQKLLEPDFCGRIGFADYALTNNSANIRRMKQRLERVSVTQATPASEIEGANARLEDCPADNRVRLFFPGKPDEVTRTTLKRHGFRWSPTLGCWQAHRNWSALEHAKAAAGLPTIATATTPARSPAL